MGKKKTIQQKEIEEAIKNRLNKLGETVRSEAKATSRVLSGDLRDSQNFRVKPFDTLTLTQNYYGKDLFLKGKNSGEKNALMVAVKKHVPETTKLIIKDMTDLLTSPIDIKKK